VDSDLFNMSMLGELTLANSCLSMSGRCFVNKNSTDELVSRLSVSVLFVLTVIFVCLYLLNHLPLTVDV